jgi:hypothetical protein
MGLAAKRCFTCKQKMVTVNRNPTVRECRNPKCGAKQAQDKARAEQRRAAKQGRKGTRDWKAS